MCFFPLRPVKGKGGRTRETTAAKDRQFTRWLEKHQGDLFDVSVRDSLEACKVLKRDGEPLSRRAGCDRVKEAKLAAYRPTNKESYEEDDRKARVAFAKAHEGHPAEFWRDTVYTDEHDLEHAGGRVLRRKILARKTRVYRKRGQGMKNSCCRQGRKTMVKGGTNLKVAAAVCRGKMILCKNVDVYKTKKDIYKGRGKNRKIVGTKMVFGKDAYAAYLADLAAAARRALGKTDRQWINILMDNVSLHWGDVCVRALRRLRCRVFAGFPPRSPSLNIIENMFGMSVKEMDKRAISAPISGRGWREKLVERFEDVCKKHAEKGDIERSALSMPRRLRLTIEADGGPIRY